MIILMDLLVCMELLGLALLLGGMIVLGALVAPTVFGMLPSMGEGGEVMSTLFSRFNSIVSYIGLALIGIGFTGKLFFVKLLSKRRYIEGLFLAALFAVSIYVGSFLTPEMQRLRQERKADSDNPQVIEQFDARHSLSEKLASANLLLVLAVLYLNAMEISRPRGLGGEK